MQSYQLSISPRFIVRLLAVVASLLLVASMIGQTMRFLFDHDYVYGLVPLFFVDTERNIPTFFTVLVALGNVMLLIIIGLNARQHSNAHHLYWFALAAGFLFLAYDEAFQVHEKLTEPVRALLGNKELGIFYLAWILPGIVGVVLLGLLFRKFLFQLPQWTRKWILVSGALYLSGCIGMEMVNGAYAEAHGTNYLYTFLATMEEGLEMFGLITLVHTLLGHLSRMSTKVEVTLITAESLRAMPLTQLNYR